MPKGKKRTNEEYEKEIEEAAKRMKKYPEHLKAARYSSEWVEFLSNIGIGTTESKEGSDFWEKVRNKVNIHEHGLSVRRMAELNVEPFHWTSKTGKPVNQYRDKETGRFISRKTLDKRY